MNMKQKLLIFALLLALGTMSVAAQKHRHHAVTDSTVTVATTAVTDTAGIEAYSDTTSVAADEFAEEEDMMTRHTRVSYDFDDFEDMPGWLQNLLGGSIGVFGGIVAILAMLFVILIVLAPFIVAILVMRYLVRRHNDRVNLASKAMETGQPLPEELMPVDKQSDDYLRRRGIRNIWIGIGMMIMFGIWGADMLTGVGALVLCYGIGQVFIARSSKNKNINP